MRLFSLNGALLGVFLSIVPFAARAEDAAPLRHLEYRVEFHTTGTAQSASYDGTSTSMVSGGFQGKISVDVIAFTKDGGMIVKVALVTDNQLRPAPPVACGVYGNGSVICPPNAPIDATENTLLAFLGRGFYDPSRIDSAGKWSNGGSSEGGRSHSDFTATPTQDPNVVMIREHTEVIPGKIVANTPQPMDIAGYTADTDVRYNTALSVPISIHDSTSYTHVRGSEGGSDMTDLRLTQDSFAKH